MRNLIKSSASKGFFKYPEVNFDADEGICKLSGESFMEDSLEFYGELLEWLDEFHKTYRYKTITFEINFEYFNTSSSKMLFELLNKLETFEKNQQKIIVNWYYVKSDNELYDDIIDMSYDSDLNINIIAK